MVAGALAGVGFAAGLSLGWKGASPGPWLMAPLGASTVLVFALPSSPLAQPWAVVGGNMVSAAVGIACASWLPGPWVAATVAPAAAIAAMMATRSLHPPGGAVALLMVLLQVHDASFLFHPVGLNSLLLVLAGTVWNSLTGRPYPHAQSPAPAMKPAATEADLDAVLARYNQVLDLPRDELVQLLDDAAWQAHTRQIRALRCEDVMSPEPAAVEFGTALEDAWHLMQSRGIKALPVVDRYRHIVGIVTQADFLREADPAHRSGLHERLQRLLRASPGVTSDKVEVVGQIMTRQVRVVSAGRPLAELVPLFSSSGHHHIPVIGPGNRLVGMLTQSDVVAALMRGAADGAAAPARSAKPLAATEPEPAGDNSG